MQHGKNLDNVLTEIQRTLKPGGMVVNLFSADKGVWREGHCGTSFLQWFPKGSRPGIYYASACRILGLRYHKGNKSVMRWSQDFCELLDKWTYYRTGQEIDSTYDIYFYDLQRIEVY